MVTGILSVILIFGGLIFFHELGHFLVARIFSIGVKTFSIGFGPTLFSRTFGKTTYQVAALPLGGYVALVGESTAAEIPEPFTEEESFSLRPAWQRFCVIAAGAIFNLFLAWFICWGIVWVNGRPGAVLPIVGEILPNSAAAASDMQLGDRILSVNGQTLSRWEQLPPLVQQDKGQNLTLIVTRSTGEQASYTVTPKEFSSITPSGEEIKTWGLGVRPGAKSMERTPVSFFTAAEEGFSTAKNMVTFTWKALSDLVSQKVAAENVGGPILIAQVIYQQAENGLVDLLLLAALISVNLGILNLLPVPVLDGGHLVFLVYEMIFRRPVPMGVQEKAMYVGIALLLGLMLFATFNDVVRIFTPA